MKFLYKYTSSLQYILLHLLLHITKADRRILDGQELTIDRNYVVYLIKANDSIPYDAWLCGGAIVSPWYIITSAACVEDVKHMYAIAGYRLYVPYDQLESDECTKRFKKKIVYVCLPRDYKFDYPRANRWANIDIALAKVEQKYHFHEPAYNTYCSYIPNIIDINYDERYQDPGTDAIVFGWGHIDKWRSMEDTIDYNQDQLRYGSVRLMNKDQCKDNFDDDRFKEIIEKYMICSMYEGNINDAGDTIIDDDKNEETVFASNCGPQALRIRGKCVYIRNTSNIKYDQTRRRGICQNDHGGPIIAWRGPKEVLIGISSVFKVDENTKQCIGPFLYTSTHCNGAFLHCLLNSNGEAQIDEKEKRRCDGLAKDSGFDIIRRTISWQGHPDGPALNEITQLNNK